MLGLVLAIAAGAIGFVFAVAGVAKLRDPSRTGLAVIELVGRTSTIAHRRARLGVRLLALSEVAVAVGVVTGELGLAAYLGATALAAAFVPVVIALSRRNVGCGCMGSLSKPMVDRVDVLASTALAAVSIAALGLAVFEGVEAPPPLALVVGAGVGAAFVAIPRLSSRSTSKSSRNTQARDSASRRAFLRGAAVGGTALFGGVLLSGTAGAAILSRRTKQEVLGTPLTASDLAAALAKARVDSAVLAPFFVSGGAELNWDPDAALGWRFTTVDAIGPISFIGLVVPGVDPAVASLAWYDEYVFTGERDFHELPAYGFGRIGTAMSGAIVGADVIWEGTTTGRWQTALARGEEDCLSAMAGCGGGAGAASVICGAYAICNQCRNDPAPCGTAPPCGCPKPSAADCNQIAAECLAHAGVAQMECGDAAEACDS